MSPQTPSERFNYDTGSPNETDLVAEGGEEFRAGEAELRSFYDPVNRWGDLSTTDFLKKIASSRYVGSKEPLGTGNGYEVIIAESCHALLDGQQPVDMPVEHERRDQLVKNVHRYAGQTALAVMDVSKEIMEERALRVRQVSGVRWNELPPELVLAGKVLAMTAHEGVRRRSGREYFKHPDEVASIIEIAWRRQFGHEQEELLNIVRFLAYAHDAFEDTIDPQGKYLTDKDVILSPLVAQKILEAHGVDNARHVARTLYYMTRTKDVDGNRMSYLNYIDRGRSLDETTFTVGKHEGEPIMIGADSLFKLTKAPDIQHNLNIEPVHIEPGDTKTREKYLKKEQYREAGSRLNVTTDALGELLVIPTVFSVTAAEVQEAGSLQYSFPTARIARRVRERVRQRLAA